MNEIQNFTAEDTRIFGRPLGLEDLDLATGLDLAVHSDFTGAFFGGLVGGLVGSALFNPYFYGGYPYYPFPPYPYYY